MANVNPFNYELDKITEREAVYDFVSRLKIGRHFINEDYNAIYNSNDKQVIFPAESKLKDDILSNIIKTIDVSDIIHLDRLKTSYKTINVGDKSVSIVVPAKCVLYRIIQEKTGYDVTEWFSYANDINNIGFYTAYFDVPATHIDTYKAYFYMV